MSEPKFPWNEVYAEILGCENKPTQIISAIDDLKKQVSQLQEQVNLSEIPETEPFANDDEQRTSPFVPTYDKLQFGSVIIIKTTGFDGITIAEEHDTDQIDLSTEEMDELCDWWTELRKREMEQLNEL